MPVKPANGAKPTRRRGDLPWTAAITALKATIVAVAVDAFVNADTERYRGKGMRLRAIGYVAMLFAVPVGWRVAGRREPYPREMDLAVAVPLFIDAAGNAAGIYQRAHVDDVIHFANGAVLTSVVGALAVPRAKTPWEAAGFATAVGIAAGAGWEILEWVGYRLGARGMALTYDDTIEDMIESSAGALVGGLVTLLRHPARLRHDG